MTGEIIYENKRLRSLYSYSILDSIGEKEYDQITNLASLVCNVPIALISLVDQDRQWFKSCVGFDEIETTRNISFCTHTIESELHLFEIEDARKDSRFKDNPLVTEDPNFVYYAGVRLKTTDGFSLGTLCVLDYKPRKLDKKQRNALNSLANQVMQLLELRKSKKLLQTEKEQFRRFTELSHLIVYRYSEDGSNVYHNSKVEDVLGFKPSAFTEDVALWTKLIHKDDLSKVRNAIKASKKGEPINVIYRMFAKSGDIKWIHDKSTSLETIEGNLVVEGVAEDITEQVKSQNQLRQLSQKYRLAVDASKDGIWEWELATGKTFYSKSWMEILGYDCVEVKAHIDSFFAVLHPEDKKVLDNLVDSLAKGYETRASIDFRMRHKDGHYKWFSARGSAIKNEEGKVTHITGSTTDITKRKQVEEENIQVRNQLQKIMDMVPSYIYAKDEDGKFLMVNKAAADVFKLSTEKVKGKEVDCERTPRRLLDYYRKTDQQVLESQKSLFIPEEQILRTDGSLGWFQTVKIPYQHPGTEEIGVLGISTEISERKEMEEELRHTKDFLEKSEKMAKVGVWEINLENKSTRWSDTTKRIHEVDLSFKANTENAVAFYKEGYNRNRINKLLELALQEGKQFDEELEIITAKGNEKWIRCIGAIEKENREIKRLYGTIQDITEEKSRECALITAQQKLQSIFNEIESIIWSVKLPNYELLFITPSAEKIFGVPLSSWENDSKQWTKFVHPEDAHVLVQTHMLLKEKPTLRYRIPNYRCK